MEEIIFGGVQVMRKMHDTRRSSRRRLAGEGRRNIRPQEIIITPIEQALQLIVMSPKTTLMISPTHHVIKIKRWWTSLLLWRINAFL